MNEINSSLLDPRRDRVAKRSNSFRTTAPLLAALAVVLLGSATSAQAGPDFGARRSQVSADGAVIEPRFNPARKAIPYVGDAAMLPQLVIELRPGVNPSLFAASFGLQLGTPMASMPNGYIFRAESVAAAKRLSDDLSKNSLVLRAFQDQFIPHQRFAFTPNDTYFANNSPAGYPGQWHLSNTANVGGASIDVRIAPAWNRDQIGTGVTIGIVDDGLERTHPDLVGNYSAADSFDFGQGDGDPLPVYADDDHGTAVSGVAAAVGGNSLGVTGAAPNAKLAGLRCDFVVGTLAQFVDATLYRSSGATKTINVKNHSYGYTTPYVNGQAERDALATSTAAGTIHVFAAGNDRLDRNEDANKSIVQNSPDAITVAALSADGKFSDYSSFGANVFVTAPSSDRSQAGVTTVDRVANSGYNPTYDLFPDRNYTSVFGGTSSASPLAAGVLAVVKGVQPALNTRFAKHLLVRSSDVVDATDATGPSDGGWKTNGAGFKFNQNYGFGLINADKLTTNSVLFTGVTALSTTSIATTQVNAAIPDYVTSTGKISRTFSVTSTGKLEEVLVNLNITHPYRGDVEAFLTSPAGTKSRLMYRASADSRANINWTFTSNAFWGENPAGTWTLEVTDAIAGNAGTWNSYAVTLRQGDIIPVNTSNTNNAEFVSQSVPTSMVAGASVPVTVTMKNNGTTTWTRAAGHLLYVTNPEGNATWTTKFAALATTDSIAPGQSKTFSFRVTAPATAGTYNFQWRMRQNTTPFGGASTNVPVTVTSTLPNNSEFVSQTVPGVMSPGQTAPVTVTFKNTGANTWTRAAGHVLYSSNPVGNTTWGPSFVALTTTDSIATGASKSFTFNIKAPTTPGTYNFQWTMRTLGVNFGQVSTNVAITVASNVNSAQFISQSVPTTIPRNGNRVVSLTFKNVGTTTWTKATGFQLISQNPALNTTWNVSTADLADTDSIAPGQQKTFQISIKAPATAGTYNFQWGLRQNTTSFAANSVNVAVVVN